MELEPAYLVVGSDRARVRTVLDRLRGHFPADAVETHVAESGAAAELVAGFGMMGLLAERRLCIVTGAHDWPAADVDVVLRYLASPSPDVVLMLVATKLAKSSRLRKAFSPPRLIECTGPESLDDVITWAKAHLAAFGARGDQAAVRRLVELCGHDDLERVRTDLERIATYAGDDAITLEMVDALATRSTDHKVWAMGDAWAARDRSAFLRLVEELLAQREHPVRLAGSLGRHLRQVDDAHHHLRDKTPDAAAAALVAGGANAWGARRVVRQAQQVTATQVDAALARIAQLDAELKGASALSGRIGEDSGAGARIVLERGLLELA